MTRTKPKLAAKKPIDFFVSATQLNFDQSCSVDVVCIVTASKMTETEFSLSTKKR